MKLPS